MPGILFAKSISEFKSVDVCLTILSIATKTPCHIFIMPKPTVLKAISNPEAIILIPCKPSAKTPMTLIAPLNVSFIASENPLEFLAPSIN